jgi:hypothetical protein
MLPVQRCKPSPVLSSSQEGMRATLQMGPMHANTTTLRVIQRVYDLSGAAVWVEWDRVQVEAGMVAGSARQQPGA